MKQHIGKAHKPPSPPSPSPVPAVAGDPSSDKDEKTTRPNRFYCPIEDCLRGFSTQGYLDSHTKFFHPKKGKPASDTSRGGDLLDVKGKAEVLKSPGKKAPDKSLAPSQPNEGNNSTDIASWFRCRICEKFPSVETQPAATFCGHLFCHKCIVSKVTSTSRCPICQTAILADRIFKLDISC